MNPKQDLKRPRNRKIMYAVAAGAVLALVVLLRSRSAASAGVAGAIDPTATDPSTGLPYAAELSGAGAPAYGSTFSDNGAAASQSLDNVTSSLQGLDQDVQGLGSFLASAPWQSTTSTSDTSTTTSTPLEDAIAGATSIVALAQQLAPAVAKPSPTPAAKPAAKKAPAATAAGFHSGHSRGHDYYLPGTGWVSKSRYTAATKKKK